jgi:hypothetical protein
MIHFGKYDNIFFFLKYYKKVDEREKLKSEKSKYGAKEQKTNVIYFCHPTYFFACHTILSIYLCPLFITPTT